MGGGEVVKKGWLIKSPPLEGGGIKAWRKRFFMLRSSKVLEYYKSADGELLKGVINLEDCRMVHSDLSHKKYKFVFDIETKERTYYLVAQTQEEMKGWVDVLCQICGLTVQDIPEFICTPEMEGVSTSSSTSGPTISSPIYSTTPATRGTVSGGVAFNDRFKPSEGAMMESMYSLAHSADAEVQRQLSREQEVPSGTPLSEALASKGMGIGTRTSSISSASGGEANTSFSSDSPSFLSPRHEPALDAQNLYSPIPKKTSGGVLRPVPKPRSATLNPRSVDPHDSSDFSSSLQFPGVGGTLPPAATLPPGGGRAEVGTDGYLRPRRANNYDQLPPGPPRPANRQMPNSHSSKQHRSALLRDQSEPSTSSPAPSSHASPPAGNPTPTYINVKHNASDEAPPAIDRSSKPLEPSPPRVDRKLKPKTASDSDTSSNESPPMFPARTSSLANTLEPAHEQAHEQSRDSHLTDDSAAELPPDFPARTTSLATSLEASTSFRDSDVFSESDLPKPSTRTMQYTQVEFDEETGKPAITERSKLSPQPKERIDSQSDIRRHPIPAPRRVNYSDIDITATNTMSQNYKGIPKHQVTLREAERQALKDKPYVNVSRQGDVDEASDPGYYTHMRNLTLEEYMEMYNDLSVENIDVSSDEEER